MTMTTNVRCYFASWQHPKTKQWIELSALLVAKNAAWLEDALNTYSTDFENFDSEFRRNARFPWRVRFDGWIELSATPDGKGDFILTWWEEDYTFEDLDESYYFHIVEDLLGLKVTC